MLLLTHRFYFSDAERSRHHTSAVIAAKPAREPLVYEWRQDAAQGGLGVHVGRGAEARQDFSLQHMLSR